MLHSHVRDVDQLNRQKQNCSTTQSNPVSRIYRRNADH